MTRSTTSQSIAPAISSPSALSIPTAQVIGRFGGGGAERLAHNLAIAIHERGGVSSCIAVCSMGQYADDYKDLPTIGLGLRGLASMPRAIWRLRRAIRRHGIRCLHIHGAKCLPFCAVALAGMRRRPALLFTWHNSEAMIQTTGWRGRLNLWALSQCRTLFGASAAITDRLRELAAPGVETKVFRNGVPLRPAIAAMDADEPVICWCARMVPSKDPQLLLRAAATLKREGLRFRVVIAGDAPPHLAWFGDRVREQAAELAVEDIVEFPGWLDDLSPLFARSAIGVQTSHTEGLSMTLLEQMMAGLGVIATDVGDTSAAVEEGITGYVIQAGDEAALTDCLRRLLTDKALRTRFGAAAHERASRAFSLSNMAEQALAEYGEAGSREQRLEARV